MTASEHDLARRIAFERTKHLRPYCSIDPRFPFVQRIAKATSLPPEMPALTTPKPSQDRREARRA